MECMGRKIGNQQSGRRRSKKKQKQKSAKEDNEERERKQQRKETTGTRKTMRMGEKNKMKTDRMNFRMTKN